MGDNGTSTNLLGNFVAGSIYQSQLHQRRTLLHWQRRHYRTRTLENRWHAERHATRRTNQFATASSNPSAAVAVFGSEAYFTANDGVHGVQLYETDGTAANTVVVTPRQR